jgi:predicted Zn-dependent peptidase
MFCAYAGTTPARAKEVLAIMRKEMHDVAEHGLPADELERAKGHMKGSLVLSLEDTSGRMSRIGKSEIGHGEILSVDELLERIDAVTTDDACRVAAEVFDRPIALTVVGPFKKGAFGEAAA